MDMIAVAVVRSRTGNQVAESTGAAAMATGPARPFRACPTWASTVHAMPDVVMHRSPEPAKTSPAPSRQTRRRPRVSSNHAVGKTATK